MHIMRLNVLTCLMRLQVPAGLSGLINDKFCWFFSLHTRYPRVVLHLIFVHVVSSISGGGGFQFNMTRGHTFRILIVMNVAW